MQNPSQVSIEQDMVATVVDGGLPPTADPAVAFYGLDSDSDSAVPGTPETPEGLEEEML